MHSTDHWDQIEWKKRWSEATRSPDRAHVDKSNQHAKKEKAAWVDILFLLGENFEIFEFSFETRAWYYVHRNEYLSEYLLDPIYCVPTLCVLQTR